ncbi:PQQ-binding-like beta-propeller repeat protein [Polymorphospora rubra]|uniref:outer membrane protein assembly factor BamB family protein n=1 Tax=Polymorphospora rubra TaxID=338584 RepID=UPI0033DAEEA6
MNRSLKVLSVATVMVATIALAPGSASAAGQGWWSRAGYTVANSGFSPHETVLTVSAVPNLNLQRTTTPDRANQSAPVMDKGRIFVYDKGGITAYDEVTGAQLWRTVRDDPEYSGSGQLVVTDGKLVAAYDHSSFSPVPTSRVEVLDVTTGAVLSSILRDGPASQLLVDRGIVVISGESRYSPDTTAYRLSDLQSLWSSDLYMYQPVSANGRLLVRGSRVGDGDYSEGLDITTGAVLWSDQWKFYNVLAANEAGTRFYVAWGHSLQVIDAATGVSTWLASYVYPKFASITPTRLYVATTDNKFIAFDVNTGAIFWTKTYTQALIRPIVAGGVLYVTVPGDRMYALNPVNGALLNTPLFTGTALPPAATNGKLYVTNGVRMSVYGL